MTKFTLILALLQVYTVVLHAQPPVIQWQKCYGSPNFDGVGSIETTSDGGSIFAGETYGNGGDVSGYHGNAANGDFWVVKLDNAGNIQWSTCLGGLGYDQAMVVHQAADGSYAVAGMTASPTGSGDVTTPNHGGKDFWVVKLSTTGSLLWQQSVGGELDDYLSSFQLTPDGGYILGGWTMSVSGNVSGNHGGNDGWIVKLSSGGSIDWQKCLGGTGDDEIKGIQVLPDGYIAVGSTTSNNGDVSGNKGLQDAWAVKLNPAGSVQWSKCFGGSAADWATDVHQTADGGYFVAGYTASNNGDVTGNHGGNDFWAIKLDNTGTLQWQQCYGGSQDDYGLSAAVAADGSLLIAGLTISRDGEVTCPTPNSSGWVINTSATGILQWEKALGGKRDESLSSIQLTADGGIIVIGNTISNELPGYHPDANPVIQGDVWVVKLMPGTAVSAASLTVLPPPANICSGSPVTLTTTTNITSPVAYEWIRDGTNISVDNPSYSAQDFTNGEKVYARIIYLGDCDVLTPLSSNIVTLSISPVIRPAVSIGADAASVCSGSPLTFTATVTGGVGTPIYQWLVNGNPSGLNSPTFTATTLLTGDKVSCLYSDNAACVVPGGNVSNTIAAQVNPVVTPGLSISAPVTTVCAGSPVQFTATPVNGGIAPIYQWLVNSKPVGTNDPSYTSSAFSDGDIVSCVMTSSAACSTPSTIPSNSLSVKVNPVLTASLRIDYTPATICSGDTVVFTATPAGAGASPVYQWQLNGKPVGSNSPTYANHALVNGDIINCGLSDPTAICATAASASVTPVVNAIPVVGTDPVIPLAKGQSVALDLPVSGSVTGYSWTPATALSDPAVAHPLASPLQTTTYILQVTTGAGCTAEGAVKIAVYSPLAIPQAFTPNGDGHNDVFYVLGGPIGSLVKDFAVYDRWGEPVFQVHNVAPDDPAFGWRGLAGGRPAEVGTYVYFVRMAFADGTQQVYKGTVVLMR